MSEHDQTRNDHQIELDEPTNQHMILDLVRTAIDTRASLRAAASTAERQELAASLSTMADQRSTALASLSKLATDAGLPMSEIDDDGTALGAVHRTWMKLQRGVAGDRGLVKTLLRSEQHALRDYEEALNRETLDRAHPVLERARDQLQSSIEELAALRDTLGSS